MKGRTLRSLPGAARAWSRRGKAGQTMIEYVIIAGMLVLSMSVFAVFMYTMKEQGGRVLDLVALDYP